MSCTERIILMVVACVFLVTAAACADGSGSTPTVQLRLLPLAGPLADPLAEVSGMTWQGDTLVIMPQFPDLFAGEGLMGFFTIRKQEILDVLDNEGGEPFLPQLVLCSGPGLLRIVHGFDGLEAMCTTGQSFYMTVEAKEDTVMAGYLVAGHFDMVDGVVIMDMTRMSSIPLGLNIPNIAEETIILDGERVITISEANGLNINPAPQAKVFNANAEFTGLMPMPQIEYRVTDATALDSDGRFWVINYFYPPEREKLDPAPDPELVRFGDLDSFDPDRCIERLLELRLTDDDRIIRTDSPPLNLELLADGECRNWEAMVRLDDRGFLLMTDKYPGTLLAFVPYPD
ncbi:MAG: hypothetical protein KAH56_07720 [Candidatus Krumholzibacteria bacterium]|nr:hypothetical protein [Candidatus Krumholzibacteria bacterium]